MFIDFIGQHHNIALANQFDQLLPVCLGPDTPTRIMRRIHHNHAGTVINGIFDLIPVYRKIRMLQSNMHWLCPDQLYRRSITVVARVENNHFFPGTHRGLNGTKNRNCRPRGNRDFLDRINNQLITLLIEICHQTSQDWQTISRCVLVKSILAGPV